MFPTLSSTLLQDVSGLKEFVTAVARVAVDTYLEETGQKSQRISQREACKILEITYSSFKKHFVDTGLLVPVNKESRHKNEKLLFKKSDVIALKSMIPKSNGN